MKGLDVCEAFYWEVVRPIIASRFPPLLKKHAAGLIGYGSDVLGHDDELSRDHEWGARCHIWLTDTDYAEYAARLNQTFQEQLPFSFKGCPARFSLDKGHEVLIPYNGSTNLHHVAITTLSRHMRVQLGVSTSRLTLLDWLVVPEQKLLEWTRGRIFADTPGDITALRQSLSYLPAEIWRYKLKEAWSSFGGLHVARLADRRGDSFSARLTINRMAEKAAQLIFLYNKRYRPGTYKWISRELAEISPAANRQGRILEQAILEPDTAKASGMIETVLEELIMLHNQLQLTEPIQPEPPHSYARGLQAHSYSCLENALAASLPGELRQLEIPGGVDQFVTSPHILVWAEHYTKFKALYGMKSDIDRSGVGDMIV